jgi:hypothetical protein
MTDLTGIIEKTRTYLQDSGKLLWSDELLGEIVALALHAYNLALNSSPLVVIAGLDGATETTLPASHEGMLIIGTVAYALAFYALNRDTVAQLDPGQAQRLEAAGTRWLDRYTTMLAGAAGISLRSAATPPWPEEGFKLDEWDGVPL